MSDLNDMQSRIVALRSRNINNGPIPIRCTPVKPTSWLYGEMIISNGNNELFNVTVGDLTIEVSPCDLLRLILLALEETFTYRLPHYE